MKRYSPKIILACSFGAEDVALVDMMLRINPNAMLFYLDTDFLFPETYEVRDRIKRLIHGEAPDRILSDDMIVELLQRDRVEIARRTVAKYRESMQIPSSVARRRAKAPA